MSLQKSNITRRNWLKTTGTLTAGMMLSDMIFGQVHVKKDATIMLVSGWQDVNIGDIGHTPGLLHVLETFLPNTTIILWKRSNAEEVKKMLNKNFPKVKIIYGTVNANKDTDSPEILEAMKRADIMIHGSGPSLVGADNLACWMKHTTKPFGVFGTTSHISKRNFKNIRLCNS